MKAGVVLGGKDLRIKSEGWSSKNKLIFSQHLDQPQSYVIRQRHCDLSRSTDLSLFDL